MTNDLHVDSCSCQFKHFDAITAEGKKNLTTYEIDYYCHINGVKAGKGTNWYLTKPQRLTYET